MEPLRVAISGSVSADQQRAIRGALSNLGFDASFETASGLLAAENKIRAILGASIDALVLADREGHVTGWSPAAEQLFGFDALEMDGKPVFSLMSERHGQEGREYILQTLSASPLPFMGQRAEIECRKKDGSKFPVELRVAQWVTDDALGYCLCLRDASEKHKQAAHRGELESQLLRAQKIEAIAALAAGIAHDFNNMLTVILGNADLAEALLDKDHPAAEAIQEVHAAAGRAASLTRQLLLFSRKQPMQKRQVDLNEMLRELAQMMRRIIPEGIDFDYVPHAQLWTVQADASLIEQAITNLVINAKEATGPGGTITLKTENRDFADRPPASVGESRVGRAVCISVSDTGSGIEPAIHPNVFDPFFTTKPPGKGAGIGLAVVARVVKDHSGWIHLESRPGEGTTIEVFLPVFAPAKARGAAAATHSHPGQGHVQRILLAEDEPGVGSFAARALRSHGFEVFHVSTIRDALATYEKEGGNFSLVFSDAVLPDGLGLTLAERVMESNPCPALLLTSGYTGKTSQLDPVVAKGIPFLPKPYTMSILLKTVREVIQQGPPRKP
jgi:two-component system cell cycle sensor histidine kinase/response regulator CckA